MENNFKQKKTNIVFILLFILGIFLNQSGKVFGVNFSYSDIILVVLLFVFMIKDNLRIPKIPLLFFITLIIMTTITSTIFMTNKYNITLTISNTIIEITKLTTLFGYFILGYLIIENDGINTLLKGFSYFSIFISIIAVLTLFIGFGYFRNTLYFGSSRFRGLMNDPNYFSILQLISLGIIALKKELKIQYKILFIILISLSILVSNSKTGFLALLLYGIFLLTLKVKKMQSRKKILLISLIPLLIITLFLLKDQIIYIIVDLPSKYIPGYERVGELIKDFQKGISSGGSSRDVTIRNGLILWKENPIFGVGIGTYSKIGVNYFGRGDIAHNTYLQLFVEWGSLLTIIFLIFIINVILKITVDKTNTYLIIFLIPLFLGSLSISLNNARIFWMLLGSLYFSYTNIKFFKNDRITEI